MMEICTKLLVLIVSLATSMTSPLLKSVNTYDKFTFVSREEWNARPATGVTVLNTPVSLVAIHHSYEPGVCKIKGDCKKAMRSMQDYHQLTQKWADIGYNFAVGGDGVVYEGRGWNNVGAHAAGYNSISMGIVLIGDFVSELPPPEQLQAAKDLISDGVKLGYIAPEYSLVGHRQIGNTECPGSALFSNISTWNRFDSQYNFR